VTLPVSPNQTFCGTAVTAQQYVLAPGACFLVPSDAVAITIGN
jgi:secreted trypsin-like serine protease